MKNSTPKTVIGIRLAASLVATLFFLVLGTACSPTATKQTKSRSNTSLQAETTISNDSGGSIGEDGFVAVLPSGATTDSLTAKVLAIDGGMPSPDGLSSVSNAYNMSLQNSNGGTVVTLTKSVDITLTVPITGTPPSKGDFYVAVYDSLSHTVKNIIRPKDVSFVTNAAIVTFSVVGDINGIYQVALALTSGQLPDTVWKAEAQVKDLKVTQLTSNSATATWSPITNGSTFVGYLIAIIKDDTAKTSGFTDDNLCSASASLYPKDSTSLQISNLLSSTVYRIVLCAKKSSDSSLYSLPRSLIFTTEANTNHAPTLSSFSSISGASQNTPFTISYATLAAASNIADVDSDTALQFRIESVSTGTLTKNAVAVVAGTTLLATGESLIWTPATSASGTLNAFTVKAWDGALLSSSSVQVQVVVSTALNCPSGYIPVPGNASLGTTDFCVMKYEAKFWSGAVLSQAALTPWVNIRRGDDATTTGGAIKACVSIAAGYDLISNAQWQTIARNIETAQSPPGNYLNWMGGDASSVFSFINRGHSDNSPTSVLDASTDNDPCAGTGNNLCTDNTSGDFQQKRTHTLSNGEIIWDFAGNAAEWVKDDSTFSYGIDAYSAAVTSSNGNACTSPACNGPQGKVKAAFGPEGDHTAKFYLEYGGLGYATTSNTAGAIFRGGHYADVNYYTGIFAVDLTQSTSTQSGQIGFRCVYTGS